MCYVLNGVNTYFENQLSLRGWVLSVCRDQSPCIMPTLFKTMVRSKLEYCCPVWNPSKVKDINAVESVQRNFTRKIAGCRSLNYWEWLQKLNLQSLQRRCGRYCIIHTWKMANELAPHTIGLVFYENSRLGIKITLPAINQKSQAAVKTDYENSFKIKASRLWNLLPKCLNTLTSLEEFKKALAQYLKNIPDTPPVSGYTAANRNSLLNWSNEKGGRT